MSELYLVYRYTYDLLGRVIGQADALEIVVSTTYDEHGNKLTITDGKNQTSRYTYNIKDQLIRLDYVDGTYIAHTYDALGNRLSSQNQNANYSYRYDDLLRLVEVKDWRLNKVQRYTYDAVSNLTGVVGPEGEVTTYRYDANNNVVAIQYSNGDVVNYAYDVVGQLTGKYLSAGVNTEYSYYADGSLESVASRNVLGAEVLSNHFTYNEVGLRETLTDQHGLHQYQYDSLGQLVRVDYPVSVQHPSGYYEAFTYNYLGDRYSLDENGQIKFYEYDAGHRLRKIRLNAITGAVIFDLNYDNNYNLTEKINQTLSQTTTYHYNSADDLIDVGLPGSGFNTYKYGPNGRRIEVTNTASVTTRYVYEGDDVVAEYNASNSALVNYRHGKSTDELISANRGGQTHYFHQDALGSVVAVSDDAGSQLVTNRYDAFGKVLTGSSSVANDYGYTGRRLDADTGLMYYRARYYDPEIGRFTQRDPAGIADGLNQFAYVSNDPISKTDPTGLWGMGGGGFGGGFGGGSSFSSFGSRSFGSFSSFSSYKPFSSYSFGSISTRGGFAAASYFSGNYRISRPTFLRPKPINSWTSTFSSIGSAVSLAASFTPVGRISSIFRSTYTSYKAVKWGSSLTTMTSLTRSSSYAANAVRLSSSLQRVSSPPVISPTYSQLRGLNKGFQAHHILPQYLGKMLGYTKRDMLDHPATLITRFSHTGASNPHAMPVVSQRLLCEST